MNAKQLIAAVIVLTATSAVFAQQVEHNPSAPAKTRAEVASELQQAEANGSATTNGYLGSAKPVAAAGNAVSAQSDNVIVRSKTRAEVIAELQQAQMNGTMMAGSFAGYRSPGIITANAAAQTVANK